MREFQINQLLSVLEAAESDDCAYALAVDSEHGVPIYSAEAMASADPDLLKAELHAVLSTGPGVVAIRGLLSDAKIIDNATALFDRIIEQEKSGGESSGRGDHFAKPGSNDRVWNSLEKHCLADPENFAAYFANPVLELVCEAWLGPAFQMTAQVNRVNPGGGSQLAHRDYHLGFMSEGQIAAYPPSVHALSPHLTLQGAIAHVDMPIISGPTMYLPHSQKWFEGYAYAAQPEVQALFANRMVQLALSKGDAVFFNPAVLHGAGDNRSSDIYRLANLLQVSSCMGRPMEQVNRTAMVEAIRPILAGGTLNQAQKSALISMSAEGYAFPCDLDKNPPIGGLAPSTPAQQLRQELGLG